MSFDPGLALNTVRLSRIAYLDADQAEQELAAMGLAGFQHFSGPSTQAVIAEDLTTRYLAFRGTESTNHIDWLRDAEFRPTPGVYGTKVHSGFRRALDEIWFDLLPMIPATNRALVITGHSLGGGLAVLTAARLEAQGHTVDAVYTYGAPRPGLRDFAGAYTATLGSRTFRVINHIDLVTRVPLLVQNFRHVGRRMYFDGRENLHADAGAWHIARDDVIARFKHFGRIEAAGIGNHEISAYARLVEAVQ